MAKLQSRDSPRESELTGVCPFFRYERPYKGRQYLYCECCRIEFKDKLFRREIIYRLCAHPGGYKECFMYKALTACYERGDKGGKKYDE